MTFHFTPEQLRMMNMHRDLPRPGLAPPDLLQRLRVNNKLKGGRLLRKGSVEAKRYMAYLRSLRKGGKRKSRKMKGGAIYKKKSPARFGKWADELLGRKRGGNEFLTGVVE